jgi:hypothetical protein
VAKGIKQGASVKIGVTPGLAFVTETAYQGMTFSTSISLDKWSVMLSFPGNTMEPDLGLVRKLFTDANGALGGLRDELATFKNLSDVSRI